MTKKEIIERLRNEFGCTSTYKNTTMKKKGGLLLELCSHTETRYFGRTRKNNQNRKSFKSMRNQIKFNTEFFNPDDFAPYVDDNSLLLTTTAFLNHELKNPLRKYDKKTKTISFTGKKYTVSFVPYKHNEKICLWTYLIKINK